MYVHITHAIYTLADFTVDEFIRNNILALAVIGEGKCICKQCGEQDEVLVAMCEASSEYKNLDLRARNFEDKLREEYRAKQTKTVDLED